MRLLLVEDKDSFRKLLVQSLADTGWAVTAVGHPQEALEVLGSGPFDVLVTDLRLPEFSGLELLKRAKRLQPQLRVLLMSAFGEPADIVEAVRWGADDFLPKPFDLDRFQELLGRLGALVEAPPPDPREPWVALNPAMRHLEEGLHRAAQGHLAVIFLGPAGSGRSRCARRLHTLRHPSAPFLALAAESLTPEAFLPAFLERLGGGSCHLSNLDLLPPALESTVLEGLRSPAGQRMAWSASATGRERVAPRLLDHLGILSFQVPGLSERPEDLLPLFRALLAARARHLGRPVPLVDRAAEKALATRPWSGHLRELAWCIDQALHTTQGPLLAPLPTSSPSGQAPLALEVPWPAEGPLDQQLAEVHRAAEAQLLRRALERHAKNLARTAESLGLTPRSLGLRLREHAIPLDDES